MALPVLAGLSNLVGGAIFKYGKDVFKWTLFGTFIAFMLTATYHFYGFFTYLYTEIQGGIDGLGVTYGGLIGCIMTSLGLDSFMTSALAIVVTGSVFWGTSVAYILSYKFSSRAYNQIFRALS
jgi:hypothetical protein